MGKFLRLINGVPKMVEESAAQPIQEGTLRVVASSPGTGEIVGPIAANTSITVPNSIEYTDAELNIFFEGQKLIPALDYTYVGSAPRTQVQFTFELLVGDLLFFEKER